MTLTANEQYLLELMNRARLDPAGEAARMGIDLNAGLAAGTISTAAKQVLAPNALLDAAATAHTLWMLSADVFSHTGAGGSSHIQRANSAGYATGYVSENIAWTGTSGTPNQLAQIEQMHSGLFLSAGHRVNLLDGTMRETGIAVESGVFSTGGNNWNAAMLTEMFGTWGAAHFLTGVAYGDANGDKFYSVGEGTAGVTFAVGGMQTTTATAGGYALDAGSGAATAVTGTVGGKAFALLVDMSLGNVKLDVVSGTAFYTSGSITLGSGINNALLLGVAGLAATGNAARNVLTGNKGGNALDGLGGNDMLNGGIGGDALDGGTGNDRLNGGKGADGLTGGLGADQFTFLNGSGGDRVSDFSLAGGDRLVLDDALWGGVVLQAAEIIDQFASVSAGDVVFDFGGGDVIRLEGLAVLTGLAGAIDFI